MKTYPLWVSGLISLIAALILNWLVVTLFAGLTGVPATFMTFRFFGPTGAFTVIGIVGAVIVYALLRRFAKRPARTFGWIALSVLIVSFLPDIFIGSLGPVFAGATTAAILLLMLLHVTTALIAVYGLIYLTRPRVEAIRAAA